MALSAEHWVIIGGVHSAAFGIFHVCFWRLFKWKTSLRSLSTIDRGVMQILNLRLIYVFLVVALGSLLYPQALAGSALGNAVQLALAGFWAGRLVEQFIFFPVRGMLSISLTALFALGAIVHFMAAWTGGHLF